MIKNLWRVCLSWWLAGGCFGLCIAIFISDDNVTDYKLLTISFILITINLLLLLGMILKDIQLKG